MLISRLRKISKLAPRAHTPPALRYSIIHIFQYASQPDNVTPFHLSR